MKGIDGKPTVHIIDDGRENTSPWNQKQSKKICILFSVR